jgi:hypothetical protein
VNFGEGLEVVNGGLGFERRVNGDVVVVSRKREGSLFFFCMNWASAPRKLGCAPRSFQG